MEYGVRLLGPLFVFQRLAGRCQKVGGERDGWEQAGQAGAREEEAGPTQRRRVGRFS